MGKCNFPNRIDENHLSNCTTTDGSNEKSKVNPVGQLWRGIVVRDLPGKLDLQEHKAILILVNRPAIFAVKFPPPENTDMITTPPDHNTDYKSVGR